MKKNENLLNENVVLESMVAFGKDSFDTLLTITDNHLLFQRKKGIFQKKYKVVKEILITDIKKIQDQLKIKQKKNQITLETTNEEVVFLCESALVANKIVEEIYFLVFGEHRLERTSKKFVNVLHVVKRTGKIIGGVTLAAAGAYKTILECKDYLDEFAGTLKNLKK